MSFTTSYTLLAHEALMLESNFDMVSRIFVGIALLFKISKNLLQPKVFKTPPKLPYFDKNQLCSCLVYGCT